MMNELPLERLLRPKLSLDWKSYMRSIFKEAGKISPQKISTTHCYLIFTRPDQKWSIADISEPVLPSPHSSEFNIVDTALSVGKHLQPDNSFPRY